MNAAWLVAALLLQESLEQHVEILRGDDPSWDREQSQRELVERGARPVLPLLRDLFLHEHPEVRLAAAQVVAVYEPHEAVPVFRALLKAEEGDIRADAATALGMLGAREAVGDLETVLADGGSTVRGAAAAALGKLGARGSAGRVSGLLKDSHPEVRRMAVRALRRLGAEPYTSELFLLLADPESGANGEAGRALADMEAGGFVAAVVRALAGAKEDVGEGWAVEIISRDRLLNRREEVVELLKDPDPRVRGSALWVLAYELNGLTVEEALPLVADEDEGVRAFVVGQSRSWEKDIRGAPLLAPFLDHADPGVRKSAVEALAALGTARFEEKLAEMLKDEDIEVRKAAALHLDGGQEAIPVLMSMLDPQDQTRAAQAMEKLADLEVAGAVPSIARFLEWPPSPIKKAALRAVVLLGAEDLIPKDLDEDEVQAVAWARGERRERAMDQSPLARFRRGDHGAAEELWKSSREETEKELLTMLEEEDPRLRRFALWFLAEKQYPNVTLDITPFLKDPSPEVRDCAVRVVATLEGSGAIPVLLEAIRDSSRIVKSTALDALSKLEEAKEAVPAITEFLAGPDVGLHMDALEVLKKWDAREALPAIVKCVKGKDPNVRRWALQVLGEMDAKEAMPAVLEALKDEDESVRNQALRVLGRLGGEEAVDLLLPYIGSSSDTSVLDGLVWTGSAKARLRMEELLEHEHDLLRFEALTEGGGNREGALSWEGLLTRKFGYDASYGEGGHDGHRNLQRALARMGSPTVIPCFLDGGSESMFDLNAFRAKAAWAKVNGMETGSTGYKVDALTVMKRIAGALGLEIDVRPGTEYDQYCPCCPYPSAAEWIRQATQNDAGQVILDADRLRILPRREADAFWQGWWEERNKGAAEK